MPKAIILIDFDFFPAFKQMPQSSESTAGTVMNSNTHLYSALARDMAAIFP